MEIVKFSLNKLPKILFSKIAKVLKNGGVVLYPTDTSYGLGADFFNKKAVNKIYKIKKRSKQKLFSVIVGSTKEAKKIAEINKLQEKFLKKYLPGKFTFILKSKNKKLSKTIGIRIPNFKFTISLSKKFPRPIVATSANVSGKPQCYSVSEFMKQIKKSKLKPDLILDTGRLPKALSSTVVDLTKDNFKILRMGSGKIDLNKTCPVVKF